MLRDALTIALGILLAVPLGIVAIAVLGAVLTAIADSVSDARAEKEAAKHRRLEARAAAGNADAQYELATKLKDWGEHYKPECTKWCRMAAEQGHTEAEFMMAELGEASEAASWLRKAAEKGHDLSALRLARMYFWKDAVEAYKWLSVAIEQVGASEILCRDRQQVADRMTAAEIAEADQWIRVWKASGAKVAA